MSMIELSVADGIAEVVLNAPKKLNAVDAEALRDLAQAYRDAERQGARALLLRGEGRGFCAGRDIAGVEPQNDDVLGYLDGAVTEAMRTMASVRIPTFAAVQGACLGVGLGLAIVRDVAERHGGAAFVTAPAGGGAQVGFTVAPERLLPDSESGHVGASPQDTTVGGT